MVAEETRPSPLFIISADATNDSVKVESEALPNQPAQQEWLRTPFARKKINMATSHQVTCITPDGRDADQRIDAIGGPDGGGWKLLIDDAISGIETGKWAFWTNAQGRRAEVIVAVRPASRRKYLKTTADGLEPNNLLALPACR